MPVTIPLVGVTVTLVLLALHVPPPIVLLSVVDCAVHTDEAPLIETGDGLIVTVVVAAQPPRTV
jgi:hypothetical protein